MTTDNGDNKEIKLTDTTTKTDDGVSVQLSSQPEKPDGPKKKKHLIHTTWLRRTLKTLMWIIIVVIIIPFLLYIPPVQDFIIKIAENEVRKSTGMDISIDRFRLKFPLDLSLQNLSIVEASGDTMVSAAEAIVDVKLLPLFRLNVDVKRLQLKEAYYRLVSPDTSMIMKIRAGYIDIDDKSSVEIKQSNIDINKALINDADIQMYLDVWKKKPTPKDTTGQFKIRIGDLTAQRIRFGMSSLPSIDTLAIYAGNLFLKNGLINLETSQITANELLAANGNATFLTPTPEYIATHPAPIDTTQNDDSPPMIIKGKKIGLSNFDALYGIAGAKPKPGFDASYLQVAGVNIQLENFYNEASTLRLPIQSLTAKERCGLQITEGKGLVALDSTGIMLDTLQLRTPYSNINATANIPFALMELKPGAPVDVNLEANIGIPDINAFMPSVEAYTKYLNKTSLNLALDAHGNLNDVNLDRFDLALPSILSLRATGSAINPLNIKEMIAHIDIDGELNEPSIISHFTGDMGFEIPSLKIEGEASANRNSYAADLAVLSPKGDIVTKGKVNLNAEDYNVNLDIKNFDAQYFVKDLEIGNVNANISAVGKGFNPEKPSAKTDIRVDISSIEYNKNLLRDIRLTAYLSDHQYDIELISPNNIADINLSLTGDIYPDNYTAKGYVNCRHLDLMALGIDTALNEGSLDIYIDGNAQPEKWIYDLNLTVNNLDWNLPNQLIHLPKGIEADLKTTADSVALDVFCQDISLAFNSSEGLKEVIDKFSKTADMAVNQIDKRELLIDSIQHTLPKFDLSLHSPGSGILDQILATKGMYIDSVAVGLRNDSLISGNISLLGLQTSSMMLDTISLGLQQRNSLLDYKLHIGNQPGTLDELANVNLNGYIGGNRVSAYLNQRNLKGETGYRLGFTAAIAQDILTLHFTPLKAMIGYMPWNFNADNYIDLNLSNYKIEAALEAESNESAILLETQAGADDLQELHLKLTNIHIQDFLQMSVNSTPLTATVNSDIRARYDGKEIVGIGRLGITDFTYDNVKVDDLNLQLQAAALRDGTYDLSVSLAVDHKKALTLSSKLISGDNGLEPEFIKLNLNKFPLSAANPFLGNDVAKLQGSVSGDMNLSGGFKRPLLNGSISCDSVAVYLPIMGSSLKFDNEPLTVTDNVIKFNNFDIWGANSNPLTIDGVIDAATLTDIKLDITAKANNFQLIGNDRNAGSDIYGKLFLNLDASAVGPMTHFTANANLNILGSTDVTYAIPDANTAIRSEKTNDVVRFVNLADTASFHTEKQEAVFMRVVAAVSISPGTQVTVLLSNNGTDRVQISPSGTVNLYRNYMGDITLNGQLNTGNGFARYNVPVIGEKEFVFDPSSYVLWNGMLMNPVLNIKATDEMKVSVSQNGGNSQLVNFLVGVDITGTLSSPNLLFDLSTNDDLTIQNQLQSMSADQRNSAAMNLLITGQYSAGGISTNAGPLTGNVYNFLTQQLNSWAAKNIRGVDLSFGVNQYDMTNEGQTSTTTSYSYQLSKSLFNNRFKISVGGNYSTGDSADDNLTQNLISDISFEYILRQTRTQTMLLKLFRHNGFESILEGEIVEMGAGFVYKRKLGDFKTLFKLKRGKRKEDQLNSTKESVDSTKSLMPQDSI